MKRICNNIFLVCLMVALSACPYKPVYKGTTQTEFYDSLEIIPVNFFYETKKGFATCSVGLRIYNKKDSVQKVSFSKSHLINSTDTLKIERIWALGIPFESDHIFYLPPNKDTVLGFYFKDLKRNFGDTVKVVLEIPEVGNRTFLYKRIQ